ncbi:hypothetical protein ACOMHN_006615 [Nucella lapillus]
MKRGLSDSDSDCDDVFDDSIKDGSPSQSCHVSDRKRRRGVIEKRRRDRINSSLSELRRLVPSAFEKQGSAKLEKAEILQMTVDYLKLLHQKGLNSYNCDPHSVAKDYRYVGFKECTSEVARYLVAVEGLDLQDPLRMRLLSHLQCFPSQRDAVKASFQCGTTSAWNPAPSFNSQYSSVVPSAASAFGGGGGGGGGGSGTLSSGHIGSESLGSGSLNPGSLSTGGSLQAQQQSPTESSLLNVFSDARCLGSGSEGVGSTSGGTVGLGVGGGCVVGGGLGGLHPHPHPHHARSGSGSGMVPSSSSSSVHATSMTPPLFHSLSQFHHAPQFPAQSLGMAPPPPHHPAYPHSHSAPSVQSSGVVVGLQQGGVKPYRPWGGELAY